MTNNSDFDRYKAKVKAKVLALLLVFVVILSGVWEYQKSQASLDSVFIVYNQHESKITVEKKEAEKVEAEVEEAKIDAEVEEAKVEAKAEEAKVEAEVEEAKVETEAEEAKVEAVAEEAKVEAEVEEAKVEAEAEEAEGENDEAIKEEISIEPVEEEQNVVLEEGDIKEEKVDDIAKAKDAVNELLDYMGDIKNKLNNFDVPVMRLDNVIVKVEEESKPLEENANFNDGEIEIYDSELGVIAVEKVEVIKENNESQNIEKNENQIPENKEENSKSEEVETEDETIDMMKNIVKRNMEEKQ